MNKHTSPSTSTPAALPAAARVAAVAVVIFVVAAAASYPFRDDLYRGIAETTAGYPDAVGRFVELGTEGGLLLLVGTAGVLGVWSLLRDRVAFWRLVFGGAGVIMSYLLSVTIKDAVQQARPCAVGEVATVLTCPEAGSWSWPSNHSTLAAAFAVACILAVPRLLWFVVPVALLAALSRVPAGVHYVHDVFSGLALGTATVVIVVAVLTWLARRVFGERYGLVPPAPPAPPAPEPTRQPRP